MTPDRAPERSIRPMTDDDWPAVRRIYAEGIATGDATLEREPPDWAHFDHSHPADCRFVAVDSSGTVAGWSALGGYSSRKVYAGVAWESVYVAAVARGQGVGRALLEAFNFQVTDDLLARVMAENTGSLALHERVGFRRVGVQERMGQDAQGRWRDVVLFERRSPIVGRD